MITIEIQKNVWFGIRPETKVSIFNNGNLVSSIYCHQTKLDKFANGNVAFLDMLSYDGKYLKFLGSIVLSDDDTEINFSWNC